MDITNPVVVIVGFILITVVLTYIAAGLSNLRKMMKERNQEFVLDFFIHALCDAAELMFTGEGRGKEKLAWVVGLVEKECEKKGLKFDVVAVTDVIEKFVQEVINKAREDEPVV
jgi:hypothetical protein